MSRIKVEHKVDVSVLFREIGRASVLGQETGVRSQESGVPHGRVHEDLRRNCARRISPFQRREEVRIQNSGPENQADNMK